MKEKLSAIYDRLQDLDLKPTKHNMETLLQTLYDLQEIYRELNREEQADGGQAADPG